MSEQSGGTACRSCERMTRSTAKWSPVIRRGEVVGHTCPACPKYDEPIRRTVNGAGVRFRVTLDIGADKSGRRRQETRVCTSLADARAHMDTRGAEVRQARRDGALVSGRDLMTVDTLCTEWLESRRGECREVTREGYEHVLKPVRRRLGSRQVQSLTRADVLALRTWLGSEGGRRGQVLSERSVRASLTAFKQVLDYGVHTVGIVRENVARGVRAPKSHEPDAVSLERWTAAEVVAFTTYTDADPHAGAWRLVAAGLRRSEVLGLAWDAVDFDAGTVTVRQSRVPVGKGWQIGRPKSSESHRTIRPDDVLPGTMTALKRLRVSSVPASSGLVVVDALGQPVGPQAFSARFSVLAAAAGVPAIHMHSTRHTVAHLLHEAGEPPVNSARYLGHTLAVHLSTYLFATSDGVTSAGTRLGQVLARAAAE